MPRLQEAVQRARDTVQSDLALVDSQVGSLKKQCDLRRKELSDLELVLVKGKSTASALETVH